MPPSTPLSYHSRPHSVAQALRNAIISGELKPGERLIELKLAESFQVGRPFLREAPGHAEPLSVPPRHSGTLIIKSSERK